MSAAMSLHTTINELASRFAHDLLAALRGAPLDEIIAETGTTHTKRTRATPGFVAASRQSGKRLRQTAADLNATVAKIVALVATEKEGTNAETIRARLKLQRKELPKPIAMALKSKKIRKRGQKRATIYLKRS